MISLVGCPAAGGVRQGHHDVELALGDWPATGFLARVMRSNSAAASLVTAALSVEQ